MYSVLLLLLPAVLAYSGVDKRIVGGSEIDIADHPWQGSYRNPVEDSDGEFIHNCGCVYVGGRWVLTAAHCGGSTAHSMEFGASIRGVGAGTIIGIATVTIHPEYREGPGFFPNDIAVVLAASDIVGDNISPATIAPNADNPETVGWITGWGRTCGLCEMPVALQGTEINIISDEMCEELRNPNFDRFQRSSMICVWGGVGGGIGACNGDSGGPLSVDNIVYGLTSWGTSGCNTDDTTVYNRVGAMRGFICETTEDQASGC